jgi:hypothetical protein
MNTPSNQRSFWPVSIISFFILAIIFVVSYVVFASRQRTDLVRQDYYDQEIRFQNHIDRMSRTRFISPDAGIVYDTAQKFIAITLPRSSTNQLPVGDIFLYRPADERLDQNIPITVDQKGMQVVDAKNLETGLWKVRVEWKVDDQEFYFEKSIVIPSAQTTVSVSR